MKQELNIYNYDYQFQSKYFLFNIGKNYPYENVLAEFFKELNVSLKTIYKNFNFIDILKAQQNPIENKIVILISFQKSANYNETYLFAEYDLTIKKISFFTFLDKRIYKRIFSDSSIYLDANDIKLNPAQQKAVNSILEKIKNLNLIIYLIDNRLLSQKKTFDILKSAAEKNYITYTDIDNIFFGRPFYTTNSVYYNSQKIVYGPNLDISARKYIYKIDPNEQLFRLTSYTYYTYPNIELKNYVDNTNIYVNREVRNIYHNSSIEYGNIYRYNKALLYTLIYAASNNKILSLDSINGIFGFSNLAYGFLYTSYNNEISISFGKDLNGILLDNTQYNIVITDSSNFSNQKDYTELSSLYDEILSIFFQLETGDSTIPYSGDSTSIVPYSDVPRIANFYDNRQLYGLKSQIQTQQLYNNKIGNSITINGKEFKKIADIYIETVINNYNYKSSQNIGFIPITSNTQLEPIDIFDLYTTYYNLAKEQNGNLSVIKLNFENRLNANIIIIPTESSFISSKTLIAQSTLPKRKLIQPSITSNTIEYIQANNSEFSYIYNTDSTYVLQRDSVFPNNTAIYKLNFGLKLEDEVQNNSILNSDFTFVLTGIALEKDTLPINFNTEVNSYVNEYKIILNPDIFQIKSNKIYDLIKYLKNLNITLHIFPVPSIITKGIYRIPILSLESIITINRYFNQTAYKNKLYKSGSDSNPLQIEDIINECINILRTYLPDRTDDISFLESYLLFGRNHIILDKKEKGIYAGNGLTTLQLISDIPAGNIKDIYFVNLVNNYNFITEIYDNKYNTLQDYLIQPDYKNISNSYLYFNLINSQASPSTYTTTYTGYISFDYNQNVMYIPIKYLDIYNYNNLTGKINYIKLKGYVYNFISRTTRQVELLFLDNDLKTRYFDQYTGRIRLYFADFLNPGEYFYERIDVEIEYFKPYYEFEQYDNIIFRAQSFFNEYAATLTFSIRVVFEPTNIDYVNTQLKLEETTFLTQRNYNVYIYPRIFNISDSIQKYIPDNKKIVIFNNYIDATGQTLTYSDLTSLLPSSYINISNDYYILDLLKLDFRYKSSENTRFVKPVFIDIYKNKYVKGQIKIEFLNSDSTALFTDFTAVNTFDLSLIDSTRGILFFEGYISDYTSSYTYENLLKLYKLALNFNTLSNIIEDIQVPLKFSFQQEIYDTYTDFINLSNPSAVFKYDSAETISIKSSASYLNEYADFSPKILQYVEYEEIYGTDPLKRKEYIYTLYLTLETLDLNILRLSQVYFDIFKATSDIEIAIPLSFFDLTTSADIENRLDNLIDVEQITLEKDQNKNKFQDFVNHYIRTKANENYNAVKQTQRFKIRLRPQYYGLNYASLIINSYVFNSRNEYIIPYVFYKKSTNAVIINFKKSELLYERKPLDRLLAEQMKNYINIPTEFYSALTQYYRYPKAGICNIYLFNSSTERKILSLRFVENTSGKIPKFTSFDIPFNPLESKIIKIEESINAQDYTNSNSGFIRLELIDKQSNIIIDNNITIPIPSLNDTIYQQLSLLDRVSFLNKNTIAQIKTIEVPEENIKNMTKNTIGKSKRSVDITQINNDYNKISSPINKSIKLNLKKTYIVDVPHQILEYILQEARNTDYLTNGQFVGYFLKAFNYYTNIFDISRLSYNSTLLSISDVSIKDLYYGYTCYDSTVNNVMPSAIQDFTSQVNEFFSNFLEITFSLNQDGIPYYVLQFNREDLLKQNFKLNYLIVINIINPVQPKLLQGIAGYYLSKGEINKQQAIDFVNNTKLVDIINIKFTMYISLLNTKKLIQTLFLIDEDTNDIIQRALNAPTSSITIDNFEFFNNKLKIDTDYETYIWYDIEFSNPIFQNRLNKFKLKLINCNANAYLDDVKEISIIPIDNNNTLFEALNYNINTLDVPPETGSKIANIILGEKLQNGDINYEDYLNLKKIYGTKTFQDMYITFETVNNLSISNAEIRIRQDDLIFPNKNPKTPLTNLKFNGVEITKNHAENGNYIKYIISNALLPDGNPQEIYIGSTITPPNMIGIEINNTLLKLFIFDDKVYYYQLLNYFRNKTNVDIKLNDAQLQRGSLFGKYKEYYVIKTKQNSEFKIIGGVKGIVNHFTEGYITINSIEVYTNAPFETDIIVKFKDGDSYIGKANSLINIGKTFSRYLKEEIIIPDEEFDIYLAGAPDTIGEYKCLVMLTYTYLGEIKKVVKEFGLQVFLPESLDNEYLILTHERIDNAINYNLQNFKTLEDLYGLYKNMKLALPQLLAKGLEGRPGLHFNITFQDGENEKNNSLPNI